MKPAVAGNWPGSSERPERPERPQKCNCQWLLGVAARRVVLCNRVQPRHYYYLSHKCTARQYKHGGSAQCPAIPPSNCPDTLFPSCLCAALAESRILDFGSVCIFFSVAIFLSVSVSISPFGKFDSSASQQHQRPQHLSTSSTATTTLASRKLYNGA